MHTIKSFGFTPILGWSASRFETFQTCKRQYFYTYYARYDPLYSKQKIDVLKRMTTIALETGNIVHDVIEVLLQRLLKSEGPLDLDRFFDYIRRKTLEYCGKKVFAEVYYHELPRIDVEAIINAVSACLTHFIRSPRFEWLTREAVTAKEEWMIEPGGYGETRIDGMKAYCKVDFLFPLMDKVFILDWKTGKPKEQKHRKQLLGYSSWASFHLSKAPSEIIPIIAYLQPVYSEKNLEFNEFDIQEFTLGVKKETEEMYSYCRDIAENIPKDKEHFIKTPSRVLCSFCNFRELCEE